MRYCPIKVSLYEVPMAPGYIRAYVCVCGLVNVYDCMSTKREREGGEWEKINRWKDAFYLFTVFIYLFIYLFK